MTILLKHEKEVILFDIIFSVNGIQKHHSKQTVFELGHEKTNKVVYEQVRHKPSCTSTEDS